MKMMNFGSGHVFHIHFLVAIINHASFFPLCILFGFSWERGFRRKLYAINGLCSMTEYSHWMETLYGWAPASMKPKSLGAYVHSSGFQGLSNIGMVVRDLHTGNIIQLESQATGGLLRVNGISGRIDFGGIFGKQSQFIVQRYLGDVVTLRCVANPKNFLVLRNGTLYANGKGDPLCRFCFHLCDGQYMKFESVHNANRYMSVHRKYGGDDDVRSLRTKSAMSSGERGTQGLFKVVLVGHMNQSFAT